MFQAAGQRCGRDVLSEGHSGAPSVAAQPNRFRLSSVHTNEGLEVPGQGWVKIPVSVQALQSG